MIHMMTIFHWKLKIPVAGRIFLGYAVSPFRYLMRWAVGGTVAAGTWLVTTTTGRWVLGIGLSFVGSWLLLNQAAIIAEAAVVDVAVAGIAQAPAVYAAGMAAAAPYATAARVIAHVTPVPGFGQSFSFALWWLGF